MKPFLEWTVTNASQPIGTLHNSVKDQMKKVVLTWVCRENQGQQNAITWADWTMGKMPLILIGAQKQPLATVNLSKSLSSSKIYVEFDYSHGTLSMKCICKMQK